MMNDIKFYEKLSSNIINSPRYHSLKNILEEKIHNLDGTVYVIQRPLYNIEGGENGQDLSELGSSFVILIPQTKILFTNVESTDDIAFEDYVDEFIDSITTLSGVFGFKEKVGSRRKWSHLIEEISISDISKEKLDEFFLTDREDIAKLEILISLISGSINTPDKGGVSSSILEAVRKRIIQFDGDQTRFIYDDLPKKVISIQGLAGTGKTELLFHRLVNLYNQTDKKIVFTCNSNVLANDIKKRLPKFFDQMKVSKREDINERVKVMRSWGSQYNSNSGLYSYICHYYGLEFINFSDSGPEKFEGVCKTAINQLKEIQNNSDFNYCFDYILIDEAQDFSDSFFELCSMVASEQVIVASDIFQTIYERDSEIVKKPNFTLNKVYRTDPKNFMFSQFLGFGLKERPVINWFDQDEGWSTSGYTFHKDSEDNPKIYEFSREPINRFSDFDDYQIKPTVMDYTTSNSEILSKVENIINSLRKSYTDIRPSDIGIVFVSKKQVGYKLADMIGSMIEQKYDWEVQKIYESRFRSRDSDKVFISNQNNVKGLEFSFLIGIVLDSISQDIESRNTIYMMMTRSFLTSYLILGESNERIYSTYQPMLEEIISTGKVKIDVPDKKDRLEVEALKDYTSSSLTFDQKVEKVLLNKGLPLSESNIKKVDNAVETFLGSKQGVSINDIENLIDKNKGYFDE